MKQIRFFRSLFQVVLRFSLIAGATILSITQIQAQSSPDYSSYRLVLERFVDNEGLVDYAGLKSNSTDLDRFLDYLANLPPDSEQRWSGPDRIAFWVNAYNAFTLKAIIDHYPIQSSFFSGLAYPRNSIRQISGVWDKLAFQTLGRDLTLDYIEHQILRKEFTEPRVHMALVCAALTCPHLLGEPYAGSRLEQQLQAQTRRFHESETRFQVNVESKRVSISPIFKWFAKDFLAVYATTDQFPGKKPEERAVLSFISTYVPAEAQALLSTGDFSLHYLPYDWSLNTQEVVKP